MSNNLEAPNVVSESILKELVTQEGHAMEIVCQGDPYLKHSHWRGSWFVKAVDPDNNTEKLLIPFRFDPGKGIKIREFKTANGVLSFIVQLGFRHAAIPMADGEKVRMQMESKS